MVARSPALCTSSGSTAGMHGPCEHGTRFTQLHPVTKGFPNLEIFAYQLIKINTTSDDVAAKIPVFQFRLMVSEKYIQFLSCDQGYVVIGNRLVLAPSAF